MWIAVILIALSFTYLIVNIKREIVESTVKLTSYFTYLIVNIKPGYVHFYRDTSESFTYLIVNIKLYLFSPGNLSF